MTYFENRGIEMLEEARTFEEVRHSMQRSCRRCVETGRRNKCETCSIAAAFERLYIDDLAEEMEHQNQKGA